MDLNFSKEDLEFRDEVREFLDKEYPKHIKEKMNNGDQLVSIIHFFFDMFWIFFIQELSYFIAKF